MNLHRIRDQAPLRKNTLDKALLGVPDVRIKKKSSCHSGRSFLDGKKRLYHDHLKDFRHTASLKIKKGHCDLFLYTPNK